MIEVNKLKAEIERMRIESGIELEEELRTEDLDLFLSMLYVSKYQLANELQVVCNALSGVRDHGENEEKYYGDYYSREAADLKKLRSVLKLPS